MKICTACSTDTGVDVIQRNYSFVHIKTTLELRMHDLPEHNKQCSFVFLS